VSSATFTPTSVLERSEFCNVHILVPVDWGAVSSVHRAFVSRVLLHGSLAAGTCLFVDSATRDNRLQCAKEHTKHTCFFSQLFSQVIKISPCNVSTRVLNAADRKPAHDHL
jgi:hypothetical protein